MGRTKQPLSTERIVGAALACLDEVGFTGFSLRGVARALGVFPAALYWHVPGGRDGLLAAAAGEAIRDILPSGATALSWQDWLRALFHNYRTAVRAHPNVAPVLGSQLLSNAGIDLDLIEALLATLTRAGFAGASLVGAYNVVIAAMVGFTTLEFAPLPADSTEPWQETLRNRLATVDPARHPTLAAHLPAMTNRAFVVRWHNGLDAPLDDAFATYVETVIGGLDRLPRWG